MEAPACVTVNMPRARSRAAVPEEPQRARAPSIRDVARLAGVSHQTVSRVLNHHPSIRPETQAARARRDGASCSTSRTGPRGRSSRAVRAPSASSRRRARSTARRRASRRSRRRPARRATGSARRTSSRVGRRVDRRRRSPISPRRAIEGLVVIAPQVRVFDTLAELSIDVPYVTPAVHRPTSPTHALSVDQIAGARMATRHLIELGHRGDLPPRRARRTGSRPRRGCAGSSTR